MKRNLYTAAGLVFTLIAFGIARNLLSRSVVVHASGAGFKGNSYFGYDSVLQALFRDYVVPAAEKKKGKVNLWGLPPSLDVFWEGNLIELRRVLEGIGLTVNTFFTKQDTLAVTLAASQSLSGTLRQLTILPLN